MIDIVIPLGTGSQHGNLELQYCLKSIDKYLTGYRNIYIIGSHPGHIDIPIRDKIIHIPAEDHGFNIQDNIRRKINIACSHPEVSKNFFFTNDDHIYLKPLNVMDLPYYYSGDLELAWRRKRKKGSYKSALKNTNEALTAKAYANYHFDIHVPIIYNKKLFLAAMSLYNWKTCKCGYVIKSLYCNTLMIKGEQYNDMVISWQCLDIAEIERLIKDRFVFSFNNEGATDLMFEFLKNKFYE